jgi:hypothetical protein
MPRQRYQWCCRALCLFAVLVVSCTRKEQSHFTIQADAVERPVNLPPSALAVLASDPAVVPILESEKIPADKIPAAWFSASEVHLGDGDERSLVVVGTGKLLGANIGPFWVLRNNGGRVEVLLSTSTLGLEIKAERSNGYRDIEITAATADRVLTSTYKFDGKIYQLAEEASEPIR